MGERTVPPARISLSDLRLMNVPECAVLGCGSFGTVWRARDVHTGHSYAVPRSL